VKGREEGEAVINYFAPVRLWGKKGETLHVGKGKRKKEEKKKGRVDYCLLFRPINSTMFRKQGGGGGKGEEKGERGQLS